MNEQQQTSGASPDHSQSNNSIHVHSPSVDKYLEKAGPQNLPLGAAIAPNFVTSEFSMEEYMEWEERMDWHCSTPPHAMLPLIELYRQHDPTLNIQIENLMPFERAYVVQLVAIIFGSVTRTHARHVTPTLRRLVNASWESLCRLGIKLPLLEKLVATSQKPTAWYEAIKGVEEAVKAWQVSSNDATCIRQVLISKTEALNNSNHHDQRELDDVERLSKLVASKEKEAQNFLRIFQEKKDQEIKLDNSYWCAFP